MEKPTLAHSSAESSKQANETFIDKDYLLQIFENAKDLIGIVSPSGDVLKVNQTMETLFGYTEEEALKMNIIDFILPEDRKKYSFTPSQVPKDKNLIINTRYKKKDGSKLYCELNASRLPDGNYMGIIRDFTERKKIELDLKRNLSLNKAVLESIHNGILAVNNNGQVISTNEQFAKMWQIPDEIIKSNDDKLLLKFVLDQLSDPDEFIAKVNELYSKPFNESADEIIFKDGRVFERVSKPMLIENESYARVWSFLEITQRKHAEERTRKQKRIHEFIGLTNELILHAKTEEEIYTEICKIAVETGNFVFAWVGLPYLISKNIKPFIWAGDEDGYLKDMHVSTEDDIYGRGPTGKAYREAKFYYCNDIENDIVMKEWKSKAIDRGFRSSVAFPLKVEDKVVSVITMYASEVNFFTDEEIQLLLNVTNNINYALNAINNNKKRLIAEIQLRKITAAVEQSSSSIVITDTTPLIEYVNPAFTKLTGYSFEEAIGNNPNILKSGLTAESVYPELYNTLNSKMTWQGELCNKKKNGEVYWERAVISPIINDKGVITNFVAIKENITELKEKQKEVQLLADVIEHSSSYISISDINRDFLFLNKAAKDKLELSSDDDIAKLNVAQFRSRKSVSLFDEIEKSMLATGRWNGETSYLTKSNKEVPVIQNLFLHKDEEGNPLFVSATSVDITILKEKEAELQKLAGIIENTQAFVFIVDLNFKFLYMNPAAREKFEIGEDEDITQLLSLDFIPDETKEKMTVEEQKFFSEGKWVGEISFMSRSGKVFPTLEVAIMHKDEEGNPKFMSFTLLDISERKNYEKEMLHLNNELRQLAKHLLTVREEERSAIAKEIHDALAQNLVAISMNASYLKSIINNEITKEIIDEQIEIANSVIRASKTLFNSLHPSMLDELGLEAAIKWYAKTKLKVTNIVFDYKTNVDVENDTKSKEANLVLFRIFQEALTNILRHANAENISVEINKDRKTLSMQITDDGVGFEPDNVDIISHHGLLGMRERVYAMNGEFNIDSASGKGTTVMARVRI